jgi:DNA polymerase-4
MADVIYRTARHLMEQVDHAAPHRLIGVGISQLVAEAAADVSGDLLDPQARARGLTERATDDIRRRFGPDAIIKGRALR